MAKSLVIVESPAKAKTINKYLGKQFIVMASLGHIKDLPKKDLAVDVENGFEPHYEVIEGKKKLIGELKAAAKGVESIYLAADPDREGEAICFHLQEELEGKKGAPQDLPRDVQRNHGQRHQEGLREARPGECPSGGGAAGPPRAGPAGGLQDFAAAVGQSAPRTFGGARADRGPAADRRTRARDPRVSKAEYWTIDADLAAKKPPTFLARLIKKLEKGEEVTPEVGNQETADALVAQLDGADYVVKSVTTREKKRNPVAPFITSTLQQEAARKLRFSVKRTMMIAQRLYEGIELGKEGSVGLITYMRTDSTRVASEALDEVRGYITGKYGERYIPATPNVYKSKKAAQDAHEAIRPSSVMRTPDEIERHLAEDELKLYRLIWMRFVASQMTPAVFDQTTIDISANGKDGATYTFRATGSVPKFDGYLAVYEEGKDQKDDEDEELRHKLPVVTEGETLRFRGLKPEQHFTEPPPRYNEATLVKKLEADGVGRPSTYASILSTIQEREYVKKEGGRFSPPSWAWW